MAQSSIGLNGCSSDRPRYFLVHAWLAPQRITIIMHLLKSMSPARLSLRAPLAVILLAMALAGLPASAGEADITLTHPTVASGGGVVEAGQFRVYFTIGEPAAGSASAGEFTVVGGLQATFLGQQQPLPDGDIFKDSFESLD